LAIPLERFERVVFPRRSCLILSRRSLEARATRGFALLRRRVKPSAFTNTSIDLIRSLGGVPSKMRHIRPLRRARQRFASASQLAPPGSSPSATDWARRKRISFESERRLSVKKSRRPMSSGGTMNALDVKRQPQYLGQCRRNRKFSCSIDKIASLPFGNTRNGSCARDASVPAQNWIAARRISSLVPKAFWSVVCVTPVAFVHARRDFRGDRERRRLWTVHLHLDEAPQDSDLAIRHFV